MKQNSEQKEQKQLWYTSLLLLLVALVCITAATTAWFTLADRTRVMNFGMDVTAGPALRFDLDPHATIEAYVQTLNFDAISERILSQTGVDPRQTPLLPVTTEDYIHFILENRDPAETGNYLEFTLNFMANQDVIVHLSAACSPGAQDGTRITSSVEALPDAMRISFTDGAKTYVYDPDMGDSSVTDGNAKIFGLPDSANMVYNEDNALFPLKENVNKPIIVRVWVEGEDPACTDEIQTGDFQIQLRFEATDESHHVIFSSNPNG